MRTKRNTVYLSRPRGWDDRVLSSVAQGLRPAKFHEKVGESARRRAGWAAPEAGYSRLRPELAAPLRPWSFDPVKGPCFSEARQATKGDGLSHLTVSFV